jgi:putative ATP-binding cassette transporter
MIQGKFFRYCISALIFFTLHFNFALSLSAEDTSIQISRAEIEREIQDLMKKGNIPGLSIVAIKGDQELWIKEFGYANLENKVPVTADTLFELGSCSKAFTALAILQLEKKSLLSLDDPVSKFFPWFYATHNDQKHEITIAQLLHHTSGIPWNSISIIHDGNIDDSPEKTLRNTSGIALNSVPGKRFEYATINYAILGAVIEKVSGMQFKDYMLKYVFKPCGLNHTAVNTRPTIPLKATGYKIGFFVPRKYAAPIYNGNSPSAYILSNAKDMARWLQLQMKLIETEFSPLIQKSHQPDRSVKPGTPDLFSYAMGWQTQLVGSNLIRHTGSNPNFSTYIGFIPDERVGVAVLANSNSDITVFIGNYLLAKMRGQPFLQEYIPGGNLDKVSSLFSIGLAIYLLFVLIYLISIVIGIILRRRRFETLTLKKAAVLSGTLLMFVPFVIGIYLLPKAIANVTWKVAIVWAPQSFLTAVILLLTAMVASYIDNFVSALFPLRNKYLKSVPLIVILSLLVGFANAFVIFLITTSLFSNIALIYQFYYFALAFFVFIVGRKVVQTKLVRITFDIVYDLRLKLIGKIILTSYQRFERLERGRIYATLNDDTGRIGDSAGVIVSLITNTITVLGIFAYLSSIAFWATIVTLLVVGTIAILYAVVSRKARVYFERARDTINVYMGLLNGLIDGFKELSLKYNKKIEYRNDLEYSCNEFRSKITTAIVKFINAFLIGDSMLIIVLGSVSFVIPRVFPNISTFTLMSFIMIMLYLIGPINGILNAVPALMRTKVSWDRIKSLERDIPANIDPKTIKEIDNTGTVVESLKAKGITFRYESQDGDKTFAIGPLDFEAKKGEIVFIIGGNGSGKTTLAKLLSGLYMPNEGTITIDGKKINSCQLGEYFSAIFDDYHLFKKLYNIDITKKADEANKYLNALGLEEKVTFRNDSFSTINLSSGQRKRLALLQCYLEDSPIYLLDEVAADQDPEFRKFFYRELLQEMKKRGKIVIAISHDDHYFDVADKIIKLDMGKIDFVDSGYKITQ